MKLTKPQEEIGKDRHRFRVVCCGRRFGKTTLAVEEIKGKLAYNERRIAYIAPTYQQARDIAWEMLLKELRPVIIKANESRLEMEVRNLKGTTSIIQLRGWESIETLRGQKFDFIVIDEVAMMRNFWLHWQEVIRPTLADTKGKVMFISTPKGFNHFYDLYNLEQKDPDYKSFHFTTYDNPYIPVEEIDKTKKEITEDRFAQEFLADFRKTEGLVYKEFNRGIHLKEIEDHQTYETLIGLDFGYTNPTGILQVKKDYQGRYFITDEWYKTEQTNDQIEEVLRRMGSNKVYADPASPDRIETLKRKGFNMMEVSKGRDSITTGIDRVRELFKQGRLFISPKCVNIIWELETYSYDPDKVGKPGEIPIKENDHLLDALRYVVMTNPTTTTINNFTSNKSTILK